MPEPSAPKLAGQGACVVVSYWVGRSPRALHRLLNQMQLVDAGVPFDLVIVCNGGDRQPLTLPSRFDDLRPRILNRENSWYNIGAWHHAWERTEGYKYYLFLQDDCFLKDVAWLHDFIHRLKFDPGIGLLGEYINYDRMSWEYVRRVVYTDYMGDPSTWPYPEHPVDYFHRVLAGRQIDPTGYAGHIPLIVLFASRRVLDEVGGFPYFGPTYRDGIASEYGIAKSVENRGHRLATVVDQTFRYLGHPQWTDRGQARSPSLKVDALEFLWRWKDPAQARLPGPTPGPPRPAGPPPRRRRRPAPRGASRDRPGLGFRARRVGPAARGVEERRGPLAQVALRRVPVPLDEQEQRLLNQGGDRRVHARGHLFADHLLDLGCQLDLHDSSLPIGRPLDRRGRDPSSHAGRAGGSPAGRPPRTLR